MSIRGRVEGMGFSSRYRDSLGRRRSALAAGVSSRRLARTMAARNVVVRRQGFGRRGPGGVEFKAVDVTTGVTACDTTSAVVLLNGIARGDDINQRNGRQVTMRSIELRGYNYVTTATGTDQIHRVCLVLDKQPNGAALTAAQVFSSVSHLAPRNLENRARFKILMDKRMTLNSDVVGEPGARRVWKIYRRLNIPVTFNNGNAGTVADIITGSVYLVMIGSNAAGVTAGSFQGISRIRYTDN